MNYSRKRNQRRQYYRTSANSKTHIIQESILRVLGEAEAPMGFRDLFEEIIKDPEFKKAYPNTGEEILRLRSYEQLHNLVTSGMIERDSNKFGITEKGRKELEEHVRNRDEEKVDTGEVAGE